MNSYFHIIFYVVTALAALISWSIYRNASSAQLNHNIAVNWFEKMDLVSHGQRFRGTRSTVVFDVDSSRLGSNGYEYSVACRTQSGREYFLRVVSIMGLVTDWEIILAEPGDFNEIQMIIYGEIVAPEIHAASAPILAPPEPLPPVLLAGPPAS